MEQRTLGSTEVTLSEISLGTWGLAESSYGEVDDTRFERVVQAALDGGVTTFDVAPLWGRGRSEEVVGRVVADKRDEVTLITRGGLRVEGTKVERSFEKDALIADCEASLKRLRTDHVDVFLLHMPDEDQIQQEGWREAVEKLKTDGKIRAVGASVTSIDDARAAIDNEVDALCLPYNILLSDTVHDLANELKVSCVGVLARSPLMHGLLSGRWPATRRFRDDDHRARRWSADALRARVRQVNHLRFLVRGDIHSMSAAALRFVLQNENVTSAILGARSAYQIEDANLLAGEAPYLPEADLERIPQVLAASAS